MRKHDVLIYRYREKYPRCVPEKKKKIIFRVSFVSNKFRNRSTVQSVLITRGHHIRITVRSTINESTGGIDRKRANFK